MKTINKKRTCVLCAVVSIVLLLFWQTPTIFSGKTHLFVLLSLFFLSFVFSFFAMFFELRQESEVMSEINAMKEQLIELYAKVEKLQSAPETEMVDT